MNDRGRFWRKLNYLGRTLTEKALLDRIVAMLTKLGQRGYAVREELGEYRASQFNTNTDPVLTPAFGDGPARA